ncbi:MAG: Ig-like domain-containing protein, partial [Anaerolineae bacterium]|nr:Ig-like domain-containing protein [Anaerolineae bacterium]
MEKLLARPAVSRFDGTVLTIIGVLIAAILLTVIVGDRVGVQIQRIAPQGSTSSTTLVVIQFRETMNWDSVVEHVSISPEISGQYTWSGTTLRFRPDSALIPGRDYTVTLNQGAESATGRRLLSDSVFTFSIRRARVAYLAPADAIPQNVWIADPSSAEQVTFSPSGINTFHVSPDGTQIAFGARNSETGTSDIKLLDLTNGGLRQLTNCQDAYCDTPVWRPDGSMIAYQRTELNSDLSVGTSPMRVWLIDLTTNPPSTRPLFSDSQILGYAPQWSADGSKISLYDNASQAILVYNFNDGQTTLIPSRSGGSDIAMSPDGTRLVFPRVILDNATARSNLQLVNLETGKISDLTD